MYIYIDLFIYKTYNPTLISTSMLFKSLTSIPSPGRPDPTLVAAPRRWMELRPSIRKLRSALTPPRLR